MTTETKFYGWNMVVVLFLVYFIIGGLGIYGPSTVNGLMLDETGMSRATYGNAFMLYSLFQGFAGPVVAKLINRKGIKASLIVGSGLLALTGLLLGTIVNPAQAPWAFVIVFGIVAGCSIGFGGPVPAQTGVNLWFNKKRALAMSLVMTASGFGGFFVAPAMVKVANMYGGHYKPIWLFVMGLSLLAMLITILFVKNKPEDLGQVPDGKIIDDTATSGKVSRVFKTTVPMEPAKALRHPKMWLITIALMGCFFSYMLVIAHAMPHMLDCGFTTAQAAMALGVMPFCSIFGRLAVGAVGDYVEPRWLWLVGVIMMFGGFYSLMIASTYTHLLLYAILLGFGWGMGFVCMPTLYANYFGGIAFASIMGLAFPLMQLAGSISPTLAGFVFQKTGSYDIAFYASLICFVIAFVALLAASPPVSKEASIKKDVTV